MINPEESKEVIDIANDRLNAKKNSKGFFRIIKEPTKVMFGSREGTNFIHEGTILIEGREIRVKFLVYQIIKEEILYTLTSIDRSEDFDSNLVAFESSLNTFVIN